MTYEEKWPEMRVVGMPVTLDQAREIIRRTDDFFSSYEEPSGYDAPEGEVARLLARLGIPRRFHACMGAECDVPGWSHRLRRQIDAWATPWGVVRTRYVRNDWIGTGQIPDGWCRPDGQIEFAANIGKWPGEDDVLADWQAIGAAFPFLHLVAAVFHDRARTDPDYEIHVRDGRAALRDPGSADWAAGFPAPPPLPDRVVMCEAMQRAEATGDYAQLQPVYHLWKRATLPEAWLEDWERRSAQIWAEIRASGADLSESSPIADADADAEGGEA